MGMPMGMGMGKGKKGMVRFRVFFDDHQLLNNSQLSNVHGRCWLLLKPSIATFADLASHLREKFALQYDLVLSIGNFVLPPFESTCIIKDEDIIRVKQKNIKFKDVCMPCNSQDLVHDPQMARAHSLPFNNLINVGEESQGNSLGNVTNENAAHDSSLSLGILVQKQKGEHLLKLCNLMQQSEGIKEGLESELHTLVGVTKESAQLSCVTSNIDQNQVTKKPFKGEDDNNFHKRKSTEQCMASSPWLDRKLEQDSSYKKVKIDVCRIDFFSLFPLIRSPLKGDILAYRYVEPLSMSYPELSSPQVGKVSAFNNLTSVIVLVKTPEFEVFEEETLKAPILLPRLSPYKEDGSLEIKLSELIDVRLLKSHDYGRDNGANYPTNAGRASSSWNCGASPAEALFWEFAFSKRAFGKGVNCSGLGKY